jgi:hypothetical protein
MLKKTVKRRQERPSRQLRSSCRNRMLLLFAHTLCEGSILEIMGELPMKEECNILIRMDVLQKDSFCSFILHQITPSKNAFPQMPSYEESTFDDKQVKLPNPFLALSLLSHRIRSLFPHQSLPWSLHAHLPPLSNHPI